MTRRGIHRVAEDEPGRLALVAGDRRVSFAELDAWANSVATRLASVGVGRGSRVAVMLKNIPELFGVWNGVARLGALVVPISYRSVGPEVAYLVNDSGASALIYDDEPIVGPVLAEMDGLKAAWPVSAPELWTAGGRPPTEDFLGATVATMNYTSGTTGRPKGIERPVPEVAREYPPNSFAAFWGFNAADVHLLCGPAYHTAPGAYAQMHLGEGAAVVIMDRFDATTCLSLIERERVTTSHMVPANFIRILEVDWAAFDRSSVRKFLHAAAPCPPAVKHRILEVFPPGTVWEYYGMSEGMATVISPEEWLAKPGSVGRAFPGLTIKIGDDDGHELPTGSTGLVYVSGFPGAPKFRYHNAPDKTSEAWRDDYFTVGDVGRLDEDGYLFLADRRVDLILRGGVNIYPAEVEYALAAHPDVVDSAVFGLPDERLGQRVHAIVELRSAADTDAGGLIEYLRGQLADFKVPSSVEFVGSLPREPNGKVRKQQLRDERTAKAER